MKILFHRPAWGNRWIDILDEKLRGIGKVFATSERDCNKVMMLSRTADVLLSAWYNEVIDEWTKNFPEKCIIAFFRRFEMTEEKNMKAIDSSKVNAIIFVSEFWRSIFQKNYCPNGANKLHFVPNFINVDNVTFKEKRSNNKKIAMVCQVRDIKNIPLAIQILQKLPDYTIHHIGLGGNTALEKSLRFFVDYHKLNDRFIFEGKRTNAEVFDWLLDKDVLLSTSFIEGNPNNVIEAMAMGIKPVIYEYPGVLNQFPGDLVFNTVEGAVRQITSEEYEPERYRGIVKDLYSFDNIDKVIDIIRRTYEESQMH